MVKPTKHFSAWCGLRGITLQQGVNLVRLAEAAANAQTREMNEENAPDSTPAITRFEELAESLGFMVIWPGLYPVLVKDGHHYDLPD